MAKFRATARRWMGLRLPQDSSLQASPRSLGQPPAADEASLPAPVRSVNGLKVQADPGSVGCPRGQLLPVRGSPSV